MFENKYKIYKIEDINEIERYIFLIAAADYIPIIERLHGIGIKASNMVIGINLIWHILLLYKVDFRRKLNYEHSVVFKGWIWVVIA